jgi:hypothetical protein
MIRFSAGTCSRGRLIYIPSCGGFCLSDVLPPRDRPRAPHATGDTGRARNLTGRVNLLINEKKYLIFGSSVKFMGDIWLRKFAEYMI